LGCTHVPQIAQRFAFANPVAETATRIQCHFHPLSFLDGK
jgi:hypothetical protein